jgi:hypothetical protein
VSTPNLITPPNDPWIRTAAAKRLLLGEDPEKVAHFIQLMVAVQETDAKFRTGYVAVPDRKET